MTRVHQARRYVHCRYETHTVQHIGLDIHAWRDFAQRDAGAGKLEYCTLGHVDDLLTARAGLGAAQRPRRRLVTKSATSDRTNSGPSM